LVFEGKSAKQPFCDFVSGAISQRVKGLGLGAESNLFSKLTRNIRSKYFKLVQIGAPL
jgi:hypothetical protein